MKARTRVVRSSIEVKLARRSSLRVRMESQISILVHPGGVLGRVVEDDAVGRVVQEGGAGGLGAEDAGLALDAQVVGDPRELSDPLHQRGGLVRVQVVGDDMPARGARVRRDHASEVGQEIGLCPGRADRRGDDPAADDIAREDEGARAVADVLELAPFDLAGHEREARMLALQGLDPGHLVRAHGPFPPLGAARRLAVDRIDLGDLRPQLLIGCRGEPVADEMRLEGARF